MSLEEENELGGSESAGEQDKATGAEMIGGEVREAVRGDGAVYGEVGAGVGGIGSDGGGVGGVEVIYNPWEVLKKAPTSLVWNFFSSNKIKQGRKLMIPECTVSFVRGKGNRLESLTIRALLVLSHICKITMVKNLNWLKILIQKRRKLSL